MRLEGKVALISGGARGQGAAEANLFAQEGAQVAFGDILDEEGRKVEEQIRELGGEATYLHPDVIGTRSIEEIAIEDWQRTMAVNVEGVFLGTKLAIPAPSRLKTNMRNISNGPPSKFGPRQEGAGGKASISRSGSLGSSLTAIITSDSYPLQRVEPDRCT